MELLLSLVFPHHPSLFSLLLRDKVMYMQLKLVFFFHKLGLTNKLNVSYSCPHPSFLLLCDIGATMEKLLGLLLRGLTLWCGALLG